MSKWYEVRLVAAKVMTVEMPDDGTEDEAYSFAICASGIDSEIICEGEIEELTTEQEIEISKRNADDVLSL